MSVLIAFLILQGGPKGVQLEIQARYDALDQAFRVRNPAVLDKLMTDDFTTVSPEGKKLDRTAALSSFKGLMMGAQHARWPRHIVKMHINGSEVIATVAGHFEAQMAGPDGKPHKIALISTVEDTWKRTPDGWRIRRSHILKIATKRDGEVS